MLLTEQDIVEVHTWLRQAGEIALQSQSSLKFSIKADQTPVTETEYRIENLLLEQIARRFPSHLVLTEEQGVASGSSDFVWALDPVDGTKPFLRGLPTWGISLGLLHQGQPVAGFLYVPSVNEMIWGTPSGAFLNNIPLPFHTIWDDSLSFIAVPANAHLHYQIDFPRLQAFGSTALHLGYLARGIATAVLTRRINLWDMAGLLPVMDYLGITYRYLSGRPVECLPLLTGQKTPEPILAAPAEVFSQIRSRIHHRN